MKGEERLMLRCEIGGMVVGVITATATTTTTNAEKAYIGFTYKMFVIS